MRFKGLAKNADQTVTLFALTNLWMARRRLLATNGDSTMRRPLQSVARFAAYLANAHGFSVIRGRPLRLLALTCILVSLGVPVTTNASTIFVENTTSKTIIYTFDVTFDDGSPPTTISVEVPSSSKKKLGGKSGEGVTKGKEVQMHTLRNTNLASAVQFTPVFIDGSPESYIQVAPILAAADGASGVFTYFDFNTPDYQELVANASFLFQGFDGDRTPVLVLASDPSVRITDSAGLLLPDYQFTGPTETIGLDSIHPFPVPEPSGLVMLASGLLILLSFASRRRL